MLNEPRGDGAEAGRVTRGQRVAVTGLDRSRGPANVAMPADALHGRWCRRELPPPGLVADRQSSTGAGEPPVIKVATPRRGNPPARGGPPGSEATEVIVVSDPGVGRLLE